MLEPIIVVHGGAWAVPAPICSTYIDGVKAAALIGYKVLRNGGKALDAVENAVINLEDNPTFNAGTGSVLTYDEQVEMDALIMDGEKLNVGCVAALKNIKNPIRVARLVMEKTPHVLLAGEGANKFAISQGIKEIDPNELVTDRARERLATYKKYHNTINALFTNPARDSADDEKHGTVGCVALDQEGHIACATSTGGITAKMPGRVGDTPVVGAGGMADDFIGGVSTTGHGEAITKACLAKRILDHIESGKSSSEALKCSLEYMAKRVSGYGGAVAISSSGDVAAGFSTHRMSWAYIRNYELHYGIDPDDDCVEPVPKLIA